MREVRTRRLAAAGDWRQSCGGRIMRALDSRRLEVARDLMEGFAQRGGLLGEGGGLRRRYLWTDAIAVQCFLALAALESSDRYRRFALRLVDATHETLGRQHPRDPRRGWLSGLDTDEARLRPTVAGLRIGKPLPERAPDEPLDEAKEWDRDGQYFHYLTRWNTALLRIGECESDSRFARWSADLMEAGGKFIQRSPHGELRMRWKMSVDLSRALVSSQGAHDPLEGLLGTESACVAAPKEAARLGQVASDFRQLCAGRDWATSDPLGIGGLLLTAARAAELAESGVELPTEARPEKLLADAVEGLERFEFRGGARGPAARRLAFRECGMSLGLRAALGVADGSPLGGARGFGAVAGFEPLAAEIESFWTDPLAYSVPSWTGHEDINAVSLAASLLAAERPSAFAG